jgi:hypothetical protein
MQLNTSIPHYYLMILGQKMQLGPINYYSRNNKLYNLPLIRLELIRKFHCTRYLTSGIMLAILYFIETKNLLEIY